MALEKFFSKVNGDIEGLPIAEGEDANLPCYFTPHFFSVKTKDGLLVSKQELTLRQMIALLSENGYNYDRSEVHYSLEPIKPKVKPEAKKAVDKEKSQKK